MASTTWRINAIDTEGSPLVLSALELWGSSGRVDAGAIITSSHAPVEGSLANLTDGDPLTTCTWASKDVSAPGFYIQWSLPSSQDAWCARFSAPTEHGTPRNYSLGYPTAGSWSWSRQGRVQYPGPDTLTPNRFTVPAFGVPNNWSGTTTPTMSNGPMACAVSADGKRIFIGSSVSTTAAWLSDDFGSTWAPVVGLTAAGTGFASAAMKGAVILTATSGSAGAVRLSRDGGVTWETQTSVTPGPQGFSSVAMSDDTTVMLVVTRAAISALVTAWLSTDGGTTWQSFTPPGGHSGVTHCAVSGDGHTLVIAGYSASTAAISQDKGLTWASVNTGTTGGYGGCAVSGTGSDIVVTPYTAPGALYQSKDSGTTWTSVFSSPRRLATPSISEDGSVLITADVETSILQVHTSVDSGSTWATAAIGSFYPSSQIAEVEVSADGCFAAVVGTGPGGAITENVARWLRRDASYTENPLRTYTPHVAVAVQGLPPDAQGTLNTYAAEAVQVNDLEFSGNGRVYGTVERKNTPTNVPLRRRVRLHRSRDGMLVRETWSKPDGSYEFKHVSMHYEYDAIAWDHEMSYRSVIANNLKPEAM